MIRLIIDESEEYEDVEITIRCRQIDKRLRRVIKQIKHHEIMLTGKQDGQVYSIVVGELYYFESVDNQTFLYAQKEIYASDLKLYELEKLVKDTDFIRVSKSLIVNTSYIKSVRALFNGKFEATLTNGEKIVINRHYVKKFKSKFLT